jgi:tetratricopeptide (TPR) repeat protein/ABC-type molybdate transport system substrate-binding protein
LSKALVRRLDAVLLLAVGLAAVSAFVWGAVQRRDALVVWSCGGNYQVLSDYVRRFERQHNCPVNYVAGPVQYLLEIAAYGERMPDVIVGRAGPGWIALQREGKLSGDPIFFAIDPLVVVVPADNPAGIRGIEDIGGEGVRVSATPHAMRPKSKVPALLMSALDERFFPGIMDAWVRNSVQGGKCGITLLEPLLSGEADVAVAPSSLLTYPQYRGKPLKTIAIEAKHLVAMKKGRASMPQCAGVLNSGHKTELARQFVGGLTDPANADVLEEHGYIPISSPKAEPLKPMLQINVPKDLAGLLTRLGMLLAKFGAEDEARRRWLTVIHIGGPSHWDARARYELGRLALDSGKPDIARHHWERVCREFPPKPPVEYDSPVLQVGKPIEGLERKPYEHWIGLAREGLASLPQEKRSPAELVPFRIRSEPLTVLESDPPKSGKRWLTLGEDHYRAGDPRYAVRDSLKVSTLQYPSPYSADAEYNVGAFQAAMGRIDLAKEQWNRTISEYPGSAAAGRAGRALQIARDMRTRVPTELPEMPAWQERFDTHPLRTMTYGMRLYHHRLPLYAFKEMVKVIYSKAAGSDLAARARYCAGVACMAIERPDAAARQWVLCDRHYPDTPWASKAKEALGGLPPSVGSRKIAASKVPTPAKGSTQLHFMIAEEFLAAEIYDDDEVLLEYLKLITTASPPDPASPIPPNATFKAGLCLERTGRPEHAREMYQRAVKRWPDTAFAVKARDRLAMPAEKPKESLAADS